MYIAHRGKVDNNIKENSYMAIKNALYDNYFDGIECDIRITKDKIFVLHHNLLYEGKLISNIKYKDTSLTKLIDILNIYTNKILLLEIKDYKINLKKLNNILNKSKRNIYVTSFNNKIINKLYYYHRYYKIGVLNYIFNSENDYHKYDFICLLSFTLTNNLYNYFKDNNIELFLYANNKINNYKKEIKYIIDNKK